MVDSIVEPKIEDDELVEKLIYRAFITGEKVSTGFLVLTIF